MNQEAENLNTGPNLMLRGGATYRMTDKDRFNLDLMGNIGHRSGTNKNIYTSDVPEMYDTSWRFSDQDNHNLGGSASLGYQHLFSEKSSLDLLASYNRWNMDNEKLFLQTYDALYSLDSTCQRQESGMHSHFWTFQADYVNRFTETREAREEGIAVGVEEMSERDDKDILDISAVIYCEKESHKGIIIGKGGAMLKKIGTNARYEIEQLLERKVNLQIFVKVRRDWRDKDTQLRNFVYFHEK